MFFGERLSAERLYDLGLINRVLPHGELLRFAREQTCKLIPPQGAGLAVRLSKGNSAQTHDRGRVTGP